MSQTKQRHECKFCGASAEATSTTTGRNQHNHRRTQETTLECDECGWRHVTYQSYCDRSGADARWRDDGYVATIPDGYALLVCSQCDEIINTEPEDADAVVRAAQGEIGSSCCSAILDVYTEEYANL